MSGGYPAGSGYAVPAEPSALPFLDAAVAIRLGALNAGLAGLFDQGKLDKGWRVEIDPERGSVYSVRLGPPRVALAAEEGVAEERAVRLAFPIVSGSYVYGTMIGKGGQQRTLSEPLDGQTLSFVIALGEMRDEAAADHSMALSELYLELTKVRSVDIATKSGVHAGALKVDAEIQGFIAELKRSANDPDRGLFVSRVETRAPGLAGPLQPTACGYSFTPPKVVEAGSNADGELNLLLMTGGQPLPADRRAGRFNAPWGNGRSDATVVLSDTLLLRAVIVPVICRIYPRAEITLNSGNLKGPAGLRAVVRMPPKAELVVDCWLSDGVIKLISACSFTHREDLSILGAVTVHATRRQQIDLRLRLTGQHLSCEIVRDDCKDYPEVQGEGVAWAAVHVIQGLEAMGLRGLMPRINLRDSGFAEHLRLQTGDILSAVSLPGANALAVKGVRHFRNCILLDADFSG